LVEGGGKIHGAFIEEGVVDDLYLYIAPKIIGKGLPLFQFPSVAQIQDGVQLSHIQYEICGEDLRIYGRFPNAFSLS
jgi:diaminohydroxyphosphoribosylaminopyrimidine deaminase/5-amino-6-(5-phosphoribosylamino)uracil reductase